jgi:3-hydroxymyristoyl/3-hydroxydecanoyl-(acyl carrier protein) dehydratase
MQVPERIAGPRGFHGGGNAACLAAHLSNNSSVNNNESSHSLETAAETHTAVYTREDLECMFLPIKQMLQLDRVTQIQDFSAICELDVPNHWVFPLHFPEDPIFPGSLLIEAAGQAVAVWAWHASFRGRPRLVRVNAKFEEPVLPQDQVVTLKAEVRRRKNVFIGSVKVSVKKRAIALIDLVLIVVPV